MKISAHTKTLLLQMLALIVVMMVGALLFMLIEGRGQKDEITMLPFSEIKQIFLDSHNVSEQDFELLVEAVRNNTGSLQTEIPWDYWNSLYFCVVVITTIGYGHIAPRTWEGQLFCIFYSLLGIPVAALLLKSVGEYITLGINNFLLLVEKQVLKQKLASLETKCFIISLMLMVCMLIIGGLFTSSFEGWTMMEGVYFTFVTLSTVGFGDFVINDGQIVTKNMTKTIITPFLLVFLILGLGVVSSVLCSISQMIETEAFTCCKKRRQDHTVHEERQGGVELTTQLTAHA